MSGPKYTIITDGTRTGKICDQEACDFFEVNQVNMVEQTGAGDAFGTGVVTALLLNKSMDEAIKWGKKQAASVVSYMGPKKGLLTLEQLQE